MGINITKKWDYLLAASVYRGVTSFWFNERSFNGFSGSNILRSDFGASYNLLNPKFWLYIKPFATVGLQIAYKDNRQIGNFFPVYGPYYYQTNAPSSGGKSSIQLVPTGVLKVGVRIAKLLDLSFNAQAAYGFFTFQTVYFDYTFYKDNPPVKRRAVFESTGTGIFKSVNLDAFKNRNKYKKFNSKRNSQYKCNQHK